MRFLIVCSSLLVISIACKKSSGGSSAVSVAPIKSTTSVNASIDTTLDAPPALNGASVTFPAGTLAVSTDVVLEKGQEFVDSSLPSEVSLPTDVIVPVVSSGLIVRPTVDVALNGQLAVSLPVPATGLRLADEKLVIFYKYFDPTSKSLKVGLKSSTDEDVVVDADGHVSFNGYFGIYWAALLSRALTAAEKPEPQDSETAIIGSNGIAVFTSSGVVTEATLTQSASNVWLQDFSQPGLLHNSKDIAAGSKLVLIPDGTGFISASVGSTKLAWTWNGSVLSATFTNNQNGTSGFKASKNADGTYDFFWNIDGSYESEAETLSLVSLSKFRPLRVTAGDVYAINVANFSDSHAEVLKFNADGTASYLTSVDSISYTWTQTPSAFLLKYADIYTFKIAVLSTDNRGAPVYSSTAYTADGKEFFSTNLGSRLASGIGAYTFTATTFVGNYETELFLDDGNYTFGEDRVATKIDRESVVTTFLWSVQDGKVIAKHYTTPDGATDYTTLPQMLACENGTVSCLAKSSFELTLLKANGNQSVVLQKFFKDGETESYRSIIDSWLKK